jgi:hypothetical protein
MTEISVGQKYHKLHYFSFTFVTTSQRYVIHIYSAAQSHDCAKSHAQYARKPQDGKCAYKRNIQGRSINDFTPSNTPTAWYHFTRRQRFQGALLSKYPILLTDLNQIWAFMRQLRKDPQYQISRKSFQWESRWNMRTDGTKLTDAFRDYGKAPRSLQASFSSWILDTTTIIITMTILPVWQ